MKPKQCGNCAYWDRENAISTLFWGGELRADCLHPIDTQGLYRRNFMYKTEGHDCPVYKERQE